MARLPQFGVLFAQVFLCYQVLAAPIIEFNGPSPFRFANIYGDHMVLQKAPSHAVVWGFGEVGRDVRIQLKPANVPEVYETSVVKSGPNDEGVWKVLLDPQKPGGPYTVLARSVVNGTAVNAQLQDVYFGDVWLCSGQSNMQFSVSQAINVSEAAAEANHYPKIRLFTALQVQSDTPLVELQTVEQPWSIASSASVNAGAWKYFSAVCWFYSKNLYDRYQYPIGLIATDWGGTAIEPWSSPDSLKECNITHVDPEDVFLAPEEKVFGVTPTKPSVLYNAMIHPFLNMSIYGAIWYQGEANALKPYTYNCTFPAMIDDWRRKWFEATAGNTDPEFPFGFVQLSAWDSTDPGQMIGFPIIRWAQTANQGFVPNSRMRSVFMAVSIDLGNNSSPWGSIHPNDKQDVGYRLALSGRAIAYNDPGVYHTGPLVVAVTSQVLQTGQWKIDVIYTNVGAAGIEIRSDKGFEIYCESPSASAWAPAQITANSYYTVSLLGMCPAGAGDVAGIRYAWNVDPCPFKKCAVYSKAEGLPSGPYIKSLLSEDTISLR